MSKFKGLIIFIEVALVGLVLLYIGFGRKKKKIREEEESSEDVSNGDSNSDKPKY